MRAARGFLTAAALLLTFSATRAVQVSDFSSLGARTGNVQLINCQGTHKVRLTVCDPSIIKVEYDPLGTFAAASGSNDLMKAPFATRAWPAVTFAVDDSATYVKIQTSKVTVRIQKAPFRVRYYDAANVLITGDDNGRGLSSDNADLPWIRLTKTTGEHFFGWGRVRDVIDNKLGALDKTGTSFTGKAGMINEAPFMYSTRGYGIFCLFDAVAGNSNPYDLTNATYSDYWPGPKPAYCAYYFMYGPSWRAVIDEYTQVSGRPHKLAKKWYGVHRDWFNFIKPLGMVQFNGYADSMRAGKFPCDIVRMDHMYDWGSVVTSPSAAYLNTLKHYRDLGFIFGASCPQSDTQWCFGWNNIYPDCKGITSDAEAKTAVDRGFDFQWNDAVSSMTYSNVKRLNERWTYAHGGDSTMAFVAVGWISQVSQSFLGSHGGDCQWDCNSSCTMNPPPYAGCPGTGYWRVFPQALEKSLVGYHADYADLGVKHDWNYIGTCMKPIISEHNQGAAGGYGGAWYTIDSNMVEPWTYTAEMKSVIRKWHALHYRFIPYLFTYAMIAHETGMPVWRHMMSQDPTNSATWDKDLQCYVGEDIIISPYYPDQAVNKNLGVRKGVWLPAGTWYDYFEGTKYTGPLTFDYNVDPGTGAINKKLPMFVRAGAIVPLMEPVQYIKEKPESLITVQVWPAAGTTSFSLYEDETPVKTTLQLIHVDNTSTTVTLGAFAGGKYCASPASRKYQIEIHNVTKPRNVTSDGQVLPEVTTADLALRTTGWLYDSSKGGVCFVNAAGDASRGFEVAAAYGPALILPGDGRTGMYPVAVSLHARTLVISVPSLGNHAIELFDALGKLVTARRGNGTTPCSITMATRAPGLYLLRISAGGHSIVKKLVF